MKPDDTPSRLTVALHGGVYAASRILNQGIGIVLLPIYGHYLGAGGAGIVDLVNVVRTVLAVLFIHGMDTAWLRLKFDFEREDQLRRFESTIVWYLLVAAGCGVGLVWLFGDAIGRVLGLDFPFLPLGLWAAITAAATSFAVLFERKLQAEKRPVTFAVFGFLRTLASLLSIVLFVVVFEQGVEGKVKGEMLAALAAGVVALIALRPSFQLAGEHVKQALRFGLPVVPHTLAGFANDMADRFLVSAYLGTSALGVYSMGYRLGISGMIAVIACSQAFVPVFIQGLRAADRAEASGERAEAERRKTEVARVGFVLVVVAAASSQIVAVAAREALVWLWPPEFEPAWKVVPPVAGGVVAWGWYVTLAQSLAYRAETMRRLPVITVAAVAVNVVANVLFLPRFGIYGAAWATLLSYTVMAGLSLLLGMRHLPMPYQWSRWAAVSSYAFASFAVTYAIDASIPEQALRLLVKTPWLAVSLWITARLSGMGFGALLATWKARGSAPARP